MTSSMTSDTISFPLAESKKCMLYEDFERIVMEVTKESLSIPEELLYTGSFFSSKDVAKCDRESKVYWR